jgi:hypothetical protein
VLTLILTSSDEESGGLEQMLSLLVDETIDVGRGR